MSDQSLTIESILSPALTRRGLAGTSKKKALEDIANMVAAHYPFLDEHTLFNNLVCRERLGSTGIGHGVAIPHCRLENCDRVIGALVTLDNPVDWDAIDQQPVDILFALIVPQEATGEHLDLLSQLARRFNSPVFREAIRNARSDDELLRVAVSDQVQEQ
ncbi:PTS IIA-like nitrogen regulatory protein PtsN [Hahella sp. SMD15-11]|uniref:PTS IIA-like nitrogen regulatory protein PtsN n=1 Tax=Thermohahella caldifontis TaxID=3142973 RepID=A0AB39UYY2_9GAMM